MFYMLEVRTITGLTVSALLNKGQVYAKKRSSMARV